MRRRTAFLYQRTLTRRRRGETRGRDVFRVDLTDDDLRAAADFAPLNQALAVGKGHDLRQSRARSSPVVPCGGWPGLDHSRVPRSSFAWAGTLTSLRAERRVVHRRRASQEPDSRFIVQRISFSDDGSNKDRSAAFEILEPV
jgi:hypothetical protein